MRFYHIQPSELAKLSTLAKRSMARNIGPMKARERLAFQSDIVLALAGKDIDNQKALVDLAVLAYEDDKKTLGEIIGSISKKPRGT